MKKIYGRRQIFPKNINNNIDAPKIHNKKKIQSTNVSFLLRNEFNSLKMS